MTRGMPRGVRAGVRRRDRRRRARRPWFHTRRADRVRHCRDIARGRHAARRQGARLTRRGGAAFDGCEPARLPDPRRRATGATSPASPTPSPGRSTGTTWPSRRGPRRSRPTRRCARPATCAAGCSPSRTGAPWTCTGDGPAVRCRHDDPASLRTRADRSGGRRRLPDGPLWAGVAALPEPTTRGRRPQVRRRPRPPHHRRRAGHHARDEPAPRQRRARDPAQGGPDDRPHHPPRGLRADPAHLRPPGAAPSRRLVRRRGHRRRPDAVGPQRLRRARRLRVRRRPPTDEDRAPRPAQRRGSRPRVLRQPARARRGAAPSSRPSSPVGGTASTLRTDLALASRFQRIVLAAPRRDRSATASARPTASSPRAVDRPKAARAVGRGARREPAVRRPALPPRRRRRTGALTGYAGGLAAKQLPPRPGGPGERLTHPFGRRGLGAAAVPCHDGGGRWIMAGKPGPGDAAG